MVNVPLKKKKKRKNKCILHYSQTANNLANIEDNFAKDINN